MNRRIKGLYLLFIAAFICFLSAPEYVRAASAPEPVQITKISAPAYNCVSIRWKKVPKATKYFVYYRESSGGKWTKLASVSSDTVSYVHVSSRIYPILTGEMYDYCVRAYDSKTHTYSPGGSEYAETIYTMPEKVTIQSVRLNKAGNGIRIKWKKSGGASYYEVLRKSAGKWVKIAKVRNTKDFFTDKYFEDCATNTYTVRAYNKRADEYGAYNRKGVSLYVKPGSSSLKQLRLLFIGNSHTYTNDLPARVAKYARKKGYDCKYTMIAHGGWYLSKHVNELEVRFNILYGKYDYVILQDHGAKFDPDSFMSAIAVLNGWIRQAGSKPVLYMAFTKEDEEYKQAEMTRTYRVGAEMIDALWIPVGKKWWEYIDEHPNAKMYKKDGHHASVKGSEFIAKMIWTYLQKDVS